MKTLLHKSLSIFLAGVLIVSPLSHMVYVKEATAQEATQTTESTPLQPMPTLQTVQEPSQPTQPDPNAAQQPSAPTEPQGSTQTVSPTPMPDNPLIKITEEQYFGTAPTPTSPTGEVQNAQNPQGESSNGGVGDTNLVTGDASTNNGIANTGNTNSAGTAGGASGGATVDNAGNGAHSNNNASSATTNTTNTGQDNSAVIGNELDSATVTGKNSTSFNTGGDSSLTTGDANTTGTIYNNVNSNLAGVSVSEFNIASDYNGDYVLDFAANCIMGCDGTGLNSAQNVGNGAGSSSSATTDTTNNNTTTQNNDAALTNNLNLLADSGHNLASFNTGGDSHITTGDANVSANVLNFMNTNVAGNVVLGVVNIFGDLVGDILLPEGFGASQCSACAPGGTTVANTNNGAHSDNIAQSNTTNNSTTNQENVATIENNLILNGTTGDNKTSFNTDGGSTVKTGEVDINAQLLNVANMNIAGGDWFLVIVNKAGQWVGQILGAPEGATFAGTSGTEFAVDENGQITASNTGNGAGSENTTSTNTTNNTTVDQNNNAHIVNNINLDANTGGNSSSYNTGGGSNIVTGDATVIANLVNFVNTNITGGRLVVSVINVFGSWAGDFVTPGQKQREKQANSTQKTGENPSNNGRGGTEQTNNTEESDNGNTEQDASNTLSQTAGTGSNRNTSASGNPGQTSVQSGNGSSSTTVENEGNENVAVLGESMSPSDTMNKAIKINMAWIVVIAPALLVLGAGGFVIRRRILSLKK